MYGFHSFVRIFHGFFRENIHRIRQAYSVLAEYVMDFQVKILYGMIYWPHRTKLESLLWKERTDFEILIWKKLSETTSYSLSSA